MKTEEIKLKYESLIRDEKLKKAHVNEFKSNTNRKMEAYWDAEVNDFCIGRTRGSNILDEMYWLSNPQLHNLNSVDKKLKALLARNKNNCADVSHIEKAISVLCEFRPLEKMHNELKNTLLSIPKKALEKKEKEERKPAFKASQKTIQTIKETLYDKCQSIKDKMNIQYKESFHSILDEFLLIPEEKRKSSIWYSYYSGKPEVMTVINCLTVKGVPIDGVEDKINKMSEDAVNSIVDNFVFKQADKLSGVLQSMPSPSSLNIDLYVGDQIEGLVSLSFEDGRGFELRSQIVIVESVKGNYFSRYPSTFHDIKDETGNIVAKMMSQVDVQSWAKKEDSYNFSFS